MYAIRYAEQIVRFGAVKANTWIAPTLVALPKNHQMSTANTHESLIKQPQKQHQPHQQQFVPTNVNNVSV